LGKSPSKKPKLQDRGGRGKFLLEIILYLGILQRRENRIKVLDIQRDFHREESSRKKRKKKLLKNFLEIIK